MADIKYDEKAKILSIRLSNKKSVDSDIKGNAVIDYDNQGNVVNIDIMKVSLDEFSKVNFCIDKILKKEKIYA